MASLLPAMAASTGELPGLASKAAISVRSNGNFVLSFDPPASASGKFQYLLPHDVLEYSPQGTVARTHTFPALPEDAVIGSAFFDQEENLIVQVVESDPNPNGKGMSLSGSYIIKELKNSSEQIRLSDIPSPDV